MEKEVSFLIREKYPHLLKGRESADPRFRRDLRRLEAGEPLAYVIGNVPFLGCTIDLRHRTLIPRPETEYWTERTICEIGSRMAECLDLFCGSGCVGIAILKHCSRATMVFADLDPVAIRQTRINLRLNGIQSDRYRIVQSNIFAEIGGGFDIVVANPPYIPLTRRDKVAGSVTEFEPATAVFGGRDGLALVRKFISGLSKHLRSGGFARMEFDPPEKQVIAALVRSAGMTSGFEKDQYGKWRTVRLQS